MSRRKPRGLTAEEQALWNLVRARTEPLNPDRPQPMAPLPHRAKPKSPQPLPDPAISAFRLGEKRTDTAVPHDLAPSISDRLRGQPVQMHRKSFDQLRRGKLSPEARIDLHGMTLDQAHGVLLRFILDAHAHGRRLVLVITGKGKTGHDTGPIPVRRGVLKHQVPQWLNAAPLRHAVLQITEAHLKHGGSGAYYVYLRRKR